MIRVEAIFRLINLQILLCYLFDSFQLEKDESGRIDLQEFTMACQQTWKNPPQQ